MVSIIYSELPWGQIRREWETTSISIAALARKYNVRSATTLERKRVAEQWSRALMIEGQVVPFTPGDRPSAARERPCPPDQAALHPLLTPQTVAAEVLMTGVLGLRCLQAVLQPPEDAQAVWRGQSGRSGDAEQSAVPDPRQSGSRDPGWPDDRRG